VGHLSDTGPVLHHDINVKIKAPADVADVNAAVGVLAAQQGGDTVAEVRGPTCP